MRSTILSSSTHSTGATSTSSCRGADSGSGGGGGPRGHPQPQPQPHPMIKRNSSRGSLSSLGSRGSRRSRRSNSSRRLSIDSSECSIESALPTSDEGAAASRKSSTSSISSSSGKGSTTSSGSSSKDKNINLYLGAGSCHRYNPSSTKKNRLDAFLAATAKGANSSSNKKKTPTSLTSHKSKCNGGMDNSDHSLGNISVESSLHASQEFSLENSLTWLNSDVEDDDDGSSTCDGDEFAYEDDVEDDDDVDAKNINSNNLEDSFYGDDTEVDLNFVEDDESSSSSDEDEEEFEVSLAHPKTTKGSGRTNNMKKRQEKSEGKVELVLSSSARRSLTSYTASRQEQHQQKWRQNHSAAVPVTGPKGSIDTSVRRSRKGSMDDSTHSMLSVLSLDKIEENRPHKDSSGCDNDEDRRLTDTEQNDPHRHKVEDTVETLAETDDEDDGNTDRHQSRHSRSNSNHSTISNGSWSEYSMGSFGNLSFLENEFDDEEDEEVSLESEDLHSKPRARGAPSSSSSQHDSMTSSRREIMNLLSRENSISRMSRTMGGRRVVRTCPKEEREQLTALNSSNSSLGSDCVEPYECVGRAA